MKRFFDRAMLWASHTFNGLAIIGLTYVVTHDVTIQDLIQWVHP